MGVHDPGRVRLAKQLTRPTKPTGVADFDAFLAAVAGQVDGLWAMSLADVVTLLNPAAYALSAQAFRDAGESHRGEVAASAYRPARRCASSAILSAHLDPERRAWRLLLRGVEEVVV